MKGIFLQQQLEFRLEVSGEEWSQGAAVSCVLTVKNHGNAAQQLTGLQLQLVFGDSKKIKSKEAGAFELVAAAGFQIPPKEGSVGPQQQQNFSWAFQLGKNAPITDNARGYFLLYGTGTAPELLGQLPLPVLPHAHIQAVLRILETNFKFVAKGARTSKEWVEVKVKPAAGKKYAALEQLTLAARFEDEGLALRYIFQVKEFASDANALVVRKSKKEVEQHLKISEYLFPGGQINREPLQQAVETALQQIGSAF